MADRLVGAAGALLLVAAGAIPVDAQVEVPTPAPRVFVGVELLEPLVTKFRSFGVSIGVEHGPNEFGLSYNHLNLPSSHLSDSSVGSVDGPNVRGKLRMPRLFWNWHPLSSSSNGFARAFYLSANAGFVSLEYEHEVTGETHGVDTFAIGPGVGIRNAAPLGLDGLMIDFTIPLMYMMEGLEERVLDNTRINSQPLTYQGFLFLSVSWPR